MPNLQVFYLANVCDGVRCLGVMSLVAESPERCFYRIQYRLSQGKDFKECSKEEDQETRLGGQSSGLGGTSGVVSFPAAQSLDLSALAVLVKEALEGVNDFLKDEESERWSEDDLPSSDDKTIASDSESA